jgi:hypothetical protein
MLPGISGSLLPLAFLESWIREHALRGQPDHRRAMLQWWRRASRTLGPASGARAVLDSGVLPLLNVLEFETLHLEPHGAGFAGIIGRRAVPLASLVALPWTADLADGWRDVVRAGRTAGVSWAVICSGNRLRIVDAARTWSRRGLEFDFELALADAHSALAISTLASAPALDARDGALTSLIARADRYGLAVCASLGDGVLHGLGALLTELDAENRRRKRVSQPGVVFEQALTVVYRLLFLLFAEARAAVPTWHRVYREAYTIGALCRRERERPRGGGLWSALQAISRLAHAGCRAGDLEVTAFNGRLFSPRHTPLAEEARIPNHVVRKTLTALSIGPGESGVRPIAYADLGVEQLGAVYERVLEYEPVVQGSVARGAALVLSRTSRERKATGSFYTPRSITEFMVRRALHPLVEGRSADQILRLRIVDPAMGSGAFLVAACRYLATAAERARVESGEWTAAEISPGERSELRRLVAQRCLYGVDRNPMAVQLARLSLWLTTLAADRPLTFLDHHLVCGDSLVGARLSDLTRPVTRRALREGPRQHLPLFGDDDSETLVRSVLPDRYRLASERDDSAAIVRKKERTLAALTATGTALARWKRAADAWCAGSLWRRASLGPAEWGDVIAGTLARQPLLPDTVTRSLVEEACRESRRQHAFHWELEFPELFFDAGGAHLPDGGFDAVITNPPWEVLRADSGADADDMERNDRESQVRFFRNSGVYRLQGSGHPNRYQLFVERALQLTRPGGRLALILPSGMAIDRGSGALRRHLLDHTRIDRLFGFHNAEGIFPIHRDVKFLLLTATKEGHTDRLACRFGGTRAAWLDTLPDRAADDPPEARPISLPRAVLESWDPDYLSIPDLQSPIDLAILIRLSSTVPRLSDPDGWGVRFGRELNATDDKSHFVPRRSDAASLPIVEGKHLEPYRVAVADTAVAIPLATARSLLDGPSTFARSRIAYRDVASATNRLTLIAALLPAHTVSTHTVFCAKTAMSVSSQYCLLALLNSLVANYLVRLQVTTHVTASLMSRVPVPCPDAGSLDRRDLITLARELEQTGIGNLDAYARANAIAARLYGLTRDEYAHVVSTFPLLSEETRVSCLAAF